MADDVNVLTGGADLVPLDEADRDRVKGIGTARDDAQRARALDQVAVGADLVGPGGRGPRGELDEGYGGYYCGHGSPPGAIKAPGRVCDHPPGPSNKVER